MSEPWRLGAERPAEFSTPVIDRQRPIAFRLDGRRYTALEGDTVLSALLANGVIAAGTYVGHPLALDAHSAPHISLAGNQNRPDLQMPMALCPAVDGAEFISVVPSAGPRTLWPLFRPGRQTSLGLDYGSDMVRAGGWIDARVQAELSVDVLVIGGGVAGLSAAITAAERGSRVTIIDQEPVLGGISEFFGRADGEPDPRDMIETLASQVGDTGAIKLMLSTLAFSLSGTQVRALQIDRSSGLPDPRHVAITARLVVLATGMAGRLPVCGGNRLPGVMNAAAAWRMAARYNVWPGQTSHIHTCTNVGYRMALLGAASGRQIVRTSDPRPAPQTRFIEFCKAYGYRLGWNMTLASVQRQKKSALSARLVDSDTRKDIGELVESDTIIVSGGWQPELDLWVSAGGEVHWNAETGQLVADGVCHGVVLAGSVAGYLSLSGCKDHGRAVLLDAFEGTQTPVSDPQIDPIFETRDGAQTVVPQSESREPPAFTGPIGLDQVQAHEDRGLLAKLKLARPSSAPAPTARHVVDIVGSIRGELIAPQSVARYCAQHSVLPVKLGAGFVGPSENAARTAPALPPYLADRFGPDQSLWRAHLATPRQLDPGCLIFANTDERAPLAALGVVVRTGEELLVLMRPAGTEPGATIYIRDGLTVVPATLEASSGA